MPFAVHELLYRENYAQHRRQQLPCPAWIPQADEVSGTHLTEWMKALGVATYEELHAWSVAHTGGVCGQVGRGCCRFASSSPVTRHCDTSAGIENARWYSQATLNIVESCFQADDDAPAVISGDA